MTFRFNSLGLTADFLVADLAIYDLIVGTILCASCSYFILLDCFHRCMAKSRNCLGLTADFLVADLAVHDLIVGAFLCASCSYFVLLDCFQSFVSQ